MRLTQYTDFALRTLIALAAARPNKLTAAEISDAYGISRNHLVKVVARLAQLGYVEAARGKGGGLRFTREPSDVRIGDVVRAMEPDLAVVECLRQDGGSCAITPACRLKKVLAVATREFMAELDRVTLADVMVRRAPIGRLLGIPVVASA